MKSNLPAELLAYIEQVDREPYVFPTNTCLQKNIKVARKAQEMGLDSDIMFCFAQTPTWLRKVYPYNPHTYLVIDGVKVDLFYARWWRTERKTKCNIRLFTLRRIQ